MNKPVTVRVPKGKRNHVKLRLYVFSALVLVLLLTALFSGHLAPYDPNAQNLEEALQAPSARHIMGTDRHGRDMFSRVLVGGKTSIFATLALVAMISVFGAIVGTLCGFYGGRLDSLVMRICDVCLAFPGLVFAMAVAALLNGGIGGAVIALAVVSWPKYSRVARSQTLAIREEAFVSAARLAGNSPARTVVRHILPNIAGPILVTAMLDIGAMMMELAGLSFLGLGARPPVAEWGSMMSSGRSMLQIYPWIVLSPGIGIFISVALFNLLGDTVRDFLDKRGSRFK